MKRAFDQIKRFVWAIVTAIFIGASAVVSQCTNLISPSPPAFVAAPEAPPAKTVEKKPARKVVRAVARPKLVKKCYDDSLRFLGSDRICWTEEVKK